jgi:L-Ala-D/L-Glu epimerase
MQITKAEVIPVELTLQKPVILANIPEIKSVKSVFVRFETRQGQSAWGCTIAHPDLTGEKPENVLRLCSECATLVPDLNPINIEYSLAELETRTKATPAVLCAFDLAFYDLLGLIAGLPLYRILGGYRNRIPTSITIPILPLDETVEMACLQANHGFKMFKVKGGVDPENDVRRVQAIHHAIPNSVLRLDADGGYTTEAALDVCRALVNNIEMIEQPTPVYDLQALRHIKEVSPVPVLADQSVTGPASALELVSQRMVDGVNIKLVACGGTNYARQIDAIARAARIATMVGCFIEPALLISAGLALALSSPNVRYADLDGHLSLMNDPSKAGFVLKDGWLIASEVPGLGNGVEL